jgi:hypothetical protein
VEPAGATITDTVGNSAPAFATAVVLQ